jgi:hypothetical protein
MSARGLRCYNSWYVPASWPKARSGLRVEAAGRSVLTSWRSRQRAACRLRRRARVAQR